MTGYDYREASTSDLIEELIVPTAYKSGYERLLLDVIRDRLWILDALEHAINKFDLTGEAMSPDEVYAMLRNEATLGDIADNLSEYSVFFSDLKGLVDLMDPKEVKKRIRTKYEEARDGED